MGMKNDPDMRKGGEDGTAKIGTTRAIAIGFIIGAVMASVMLVSWLSMLGKMQL